jgi:hypothetical protein
VCICEAGLFAQSYPPPFPRKDATELIDNERVEVWDVLWPKGQPSPMHLHQYDQISITLGPGSVKVTRPDGAASTGKSEFGSLGFVHKGTIHAEEGTSDVPQHKIMVELKPFAASEVHSREGVPPAFPRDGAKKVLETDGAVVWDFTFSPGMPIARYADYRDSVVLFLEGGTIRSSAGEGGTKEVVRKQGEVVYLPHTSEAHTDTAVNGSPRIIVVELK